MGNTNTIPKQGKKSKFLGIMDSIATKYILNQDFQDLVNLSKKEYCDKLLILTSDIFRKNFTQNDIVYLDQRTKEGITVNSLTSSEIAFMNKDTMNKLDVQNKIVKNRMCIGISKFYIKIAHLYASLIMTLNPTYQYRDSNGALRSVPFMNKKFIPSNLRSNMKLKKVNLCSRRINSILFEPEKTRDICGNMIETGYTNISNDICYLNREPGLNSKNNGETRKLIDEIGLSELNRLYYDVFDYDKGIYNDMSDESKKEYRESLKIFYKTFTGNKDVPSNLKSFSDITLKGFHKHKSCNDNSIMNEKIKVKNDNKYFILLGNALNKSVRETNKIRDSFISILDEIFIEQVDNVTKNKEVIIHPNLTMEKLDKLVSLTRREIGKLYVKCERDFMNILNIYEALLEDRIRKNIDMRIKRIKELTDKKLI
ncbi:MAG: hypothetical protein CMF62_00020 [Magnetococcales bacterium]|nr:hypothetical protein [Magnetococcales bacterium]|tara:strand:- start:97 stop:1374 length:1278 start_codon:yes stop_codon:yes gene_type:complete